MEHAIDPAIEHLVISDHWFERRGDGVRIVLETGSGRFALAVPSDPDRFLETMADLDDLVQEREGEGRPVRDGKVMLMWSGWHALLPPAWDAGGGPVDEED